MSAHSEPSRDAVVALYTRLLESWNARDAAAFGAQFATNGSAVGFDGSQQVSSSTQADHHRGVRTRGPADRRTPAPTRRAYVHNSP